MVDVDRDANITDAVESVMMKMIKMMKMDVDSMILMKIVVVREELLFCLPIYC